MYDAAKTGAVGLYLGRCHQLQRPGVVARVVHSERSEHARLGQFIQRPAGDSLQDILHRDEVQTTVHKLRPRLAVTRAVADMVHQDEPFLKRGGIGVICQQHFPLRIGRQSRHMRHHVAHRSLALELGQVGVHRRIQVQQPFVHKRHRRHTRADHLAQRRQIENGVRRHVLERGINLPVTVGFVVDHLAVLHHTEHRARNDRVGNGRFDK